MTVERLDWPAHLLDSVGTDLAGTRHAVGGHTLGGVGGKVGRGGGGRGGGGGGSGGGGGGGEEDTEDE